MCFGTLKYLSIALNTSRLCLSVFLHPPNEVPLSFVSFCWLRSLSKPHLWTLSRGEPLPNNRILCKHNPIVRRLHAGRALRGLERALGLAQETLSWLRFSGFCNKKLRFPCGKRSNNYFELNYPKQY